MKAYRLVLVLLVVFDMGVSARAQQRSANPPNPQREQQGGLGPGQQDDQRRARLEQAIAAVQAAGAAYQDNLALRFNAGPSGAWWTNANLLGRLGITDEQKAKLDRAFENHRSQLESSKQLLEKEEAQLAKLLDADTVDRNGVLTQIDRVVQARGEMERANSAMSLEMREVLTRAQWNQLPQPSVGTTVTTRFTGTVTATPPGTQPAPPAGGRGGGLGAGQRTGGRGGARGGGPAAPAGGGQRTPFGDRQQ